MNAFNDLDKYPWMWGVNREWGEDQLINVGTISVAALKSKWHQDCRWWIYYQIGKNYRRVDDLESDSLSDARGQPIFTLAYRILHHIRMEGLDPKIEIKNIVCQAGYDADPPPSFVIYTPRKRSTILSLVCKVHGVPSLEAFLKAQ